LCDRSRRGSLIRYLREWEIDCAILQETHIDCAFDKAWEEMRAGSANDLVVVNSIGRSGGIAIWWRKQMLCLQEVSMARHLLTCRFTRGQGDSVFFVTGVYGPNDPNRR
jgi:hypothetical protein